MPEKDPDKKNVSCRIQFVRTEREETSYCGNVLTPRERILESLMDKIQGLKDDEKGW